VTAGLCFSVGGMLFSVPLLTPYQEQQLKQKPGAENKGL